MLVSLDGFRWDYLGRGVTPHLQRIAERGVSARQLVPVFPTKTFPNHYTIVTGLLPEAHGIVANNFRDSELDATFRLSDRGAVGDGRWYGGEPLWVTAERRGRRAAAFFWPGTEARIDGVRPSEWRAYDGSIQGPRRVAQVLEWLARPDNERPSLITLYFSSIDDAGHSYGPGDSPQLRHELAAVDRLIGRLTRGVDRLGRDIHLVVVSDHGMAEISPRRVVFLDDYVDLEVAGVVDWTPVAALWPEPSRREAVYAALDGAHPHLAVYRREEIPERFSYRHHPRIPPIVAIADEGWSISSRPYFARRRDDFSGGNHGYDNRLDSMAGLFVAAGPRLQGGRRIDRIEGTEIYPLLCELLEIPPAPGQGRPGGWEALLR